MTRRRGRGRRHRRRGGRSLRRSRRGTGGFGKRLLSFFKRPISHIVAPTLGISGLLALILVPLPNGDSWMNRLQMGFAGDWSIGGGGGAGVLFVQQVITNLPTAIPLFAGGIIAGLIGRWTRT